MSVNFGPNLPEHLILYLDAANPKSYIPGSSFWYDLTKNSNTGTLINGPTYNSNNLGNIVFDGVDDIVNISSINTISTLTSEFTVEIRLKIDPTFTGEWGTILGNSPGNPALCTFQIIFDDRAIVQPWNPSGVANNRAIVAWAGTGGSATLRYLWKTNTFTGNTSTITLSCNLHNVYLYVDGVLAMSNLFLGNIGILTPNANLPYRDLTIFNTYLTSNDYPTKGNVQYVKLYNKALSADEVLKNYNTTKRL